ncbi:MAG TPA: hypothetical protein VIA62_17550 [Thermoanaerobaculia bacterium]|jgi:hypothetical protein|nr:hypothetical protein [Thermoanaerobaculia bacterium]
MSVTRPAVAEYLRFLGWVVGVGVALALLGYAPTRRLGGEGALPAMVAGCVIGVVASAVGALTVLSARRSGAALPLQGMLAALALRFVTALVLGLVAGLSGWFETRPLLIWIALGYVAQLALDTRYATRGF